MIHFIAEGYRGSSYLYQFTFKSALLRGNINEIRRISILLFNMGNLEILKNYSFTNIYSYVTNFS